MPIDLLSFPRSLAAALSDLLALLRDRRLAALLLALALLLVLAAQPSLQYQVEVGQEDGPGGDLPMVSGFYPPEVGPLGDFRWTTDRAVFDIPGVGQRPLQVALHVYPINEEVQQRGPRAVEVWWEKRIVAQLPVYPQGAVFHFTLPPPVDGSGNQRFELRSSTFNPTNDARSIGVPISRLRLAAPAGPVLPAWRAILLWLVVAALGWIAVRSAGFSPRGTLLLLLPLTLLLGLAALLDPPRVALGAGPALLALAGGLLVVQLLRVAAPALARRIDLPLHAPALRWLLLLALLVFAARYGGKIYPSSMIGDIGFHSNRFAEVIEGRVLLLSRNRGVDFPYPPALYLILAPFTLLGIGRPVLLQFGAALIDAVSPFLVYTIAALGLGLGDRPARRSTTPAVLAAALYAGSAAGFMTTWWNFSTHIFAQFAHLLLIAAIVVLWHRWRGRPGAFEGWSAGLVLAALIVLQSLVYLGHFGFWMNMSLLAAIGLAVLLAGAWRGRGGWPAARLLLAGFVLAEAFAAVFFYTGYFGMFAEQAAAASQGGLTNVAGRPPAPLDALWRTLWDAGLRVHFGFFPVPLALGGLALLWSRQRWQAAALQIGQAARQVFPAPLLALLVLISGTFLIAVGFAALPFISRSTLSTRWLMFSAWAIAVAAVPVALRIWRFGRAGRLVASAMGGYILWITVSQWLMALAWRVRPPEPF